MDGVNLGPSSIDGLMKMFDHKTGDELCQYVHAVTWMAFSIPKFAESISPLRGLLEKAYRSVGKRTKKSIARIRLKKWAGMIYTYRNFAASKNNFNKKWSTQNIEIRTRLFPFMLIQAMPSGLRLSHSTTRSSCKNLQPTKNMTHSLFFSVHFKMPESTGKNLRKKH